VLFGAEQTMPNQANGPRNPLAVLQFSELSHNVHHSSAKINISGTESHQLTSAGR